MKVSSSPDGTSVACDVKWANNLDERVAILQLARCAHAADTR